MRTLNQETVAALPAQLKLTRQAYARYFARSPRHERALYRSTFVPYSLRRYLAFGRGEAPHWLEAREHVEHGCLCPAQIVALSAGLVATFTNLNAREERSFPAVKIRAEPLHLLPGRLRHEGARLACVSIFHASAESWQAGYWDDFSPLPVDCLVPEERACEAARDRLSPFAWKALALALAELGERYEPGLHRVAVPYEIVRNAF